MDSSYFLIANSTNTSNINNELEQSSSSSSLNYDPFDGFSLLDQQGTRLYDYFSGSGECGAGGGGGGRGSPLINQCPLDQIDLQQKNFPFQINPNQEDDDDFQETLTSFVGDLGVDSDGGYTSGVDLFATNAIVDCSDSTEAYCLRLALEQNNNIGYNNISNNNNCSDINNNYNSNSIYDCNSYNSCDGDSNTSHSTKRSVLMNLLIDGSDVGAGYTSHNCRALPQKIIQQQPNIN